MCRELFVGLLTGFRLWIGAMATIIRVAAFLYPQAPRRAVI